MGGWPWEERGVMVVMGVDEAGRASRRSRVRVQGRVWSRGLSGMSLFVRC